MNWSRQLSYKYTLDFLDCIEAKVFSLYCKYLLGTQSHLNRLQILTVNNKTFNSLGGLVMCEKLLNIVVTIFSFTLGLAYLIVSLLPQTPPPNSLFINWQNHRDFWAEGLDLQVPPNHHLTTCIQVSHPLPAHTRKVEANNTYSLN